MVESSLIHFTFCMNTEFLATQYSDQKVWSHVLKLQKKLGDEFCLLRLTVNDHIVSHLSLACVLRQWILTRWLGLHRVFITCILFCYASFFFFITLMKQPLDLTTWYINFSYQQSYE
jgi:hypothetical protein